jgi:peroxiredoxin
LKLWASAVSFRYAIKLNESCATEVLTNIIYLCSHLTTEIPHHKGIPVESFYLFLLLARTIA